MIQSATLRAVEAILFAAASPVSTAELKRRLPGHDVDGALASLMEHYSGRGIRLAEFNSRWAFRSAEDLRDLLQDVKSDDRGYGQSVLEVLAIIAYHQPLTRAEIDKVRCGVSSESAIRKLIECGWIESRRRETVPGRPMEYRTTQGFLESFNLRRITDLPSLQEIGLNPVLP